MLHDSQVTGGHAPHAVLFVTKGSFERIQKHFCHVRGDILQSFQSILIEFNELAGEVKPFSRRLFVGKFLKEHGSPFIFIFRTLDLSHVHPRDERERDGQKQDGDDFIDDKVLRVEVQMVPNPDPADEQDDQGQGHGDVGLSPLVVEMR